MAKIASPASDPRFLRRHYPHQVQGVSSTFLAKCWTLSHCGSPAFSFSLRIRLTCSKSTNRDVVGRQTWRFTKRDANSLNWRQELSRGRRSGFFFYIGVENGEPLTVLQFPDGPGIVGARGILSIRRALDLHLISGNDDVLFIGEHLKIANLKRFHVPVFHIGEFILKTGGDAIRVNAPDIFVDEFLEGVRVLVLECLPGSLFLFFHRGLVRRCGDRNCDGGNEGDDCVGEIFFHYFLSLGLSAEIRLRHSNRWSSRKNARLHAATSKSLPHGTMGADSRDDLRGGVDVCCGVKNADLPTKLIRLASASFS